MNVDLTGFYQIAISLASHFDSMYYVDIKSDAFIQFMPSKLVSNIQFPESGKDFYNLIKKLAEKFVHPDDLDNLLSLIDKEKVLLAVSQKKSYSIYFRINLDGKVLHVRIVIFMCEDKQHLLFCLENIEAEFQEKAEQKKNLQSAERMARRDELTGIKNKNAFTEESLILDSRIKKEGNYIKFGIVMCDVNDLKLINDTRGHSFGDEAIQRTSRIICDIFKHSPVFRIGGDEFVVIITEHDYEHREILLKNLKEESFQNKKSRTGPVIACGLAVFEAEKDKDFSDVFKRADRQMYENKKEIKSTGADEKTLKKAIFNSPPITVERKRKLDGLFGSFLTMAGDGYVFLDDMKYDFSRWAISLVNDFGMENEYLYAAEQKWETLVHPEDLPAYRDVILKILSGNEELHPLVYRVRRSDGKYIQVTFRGFVLNDDDGSPDYFGGIIIPT